MKLLHEQIMGAVVIAGLVAMGLFVAEEPELPRWMSGRFLTQKSEQLTTVTVSNIDWSADGKSLLCQWRGGTTAMSSLTVHDVATSCGYTPSWIGAIASGISHSSFSPAGSSVVVATYTGELWWIDLETSAATELVRLSPQALFTATAIGHDGQLMAAGTESGLVHLCDPTRGDSKVLKSERSSPIARVRFSNDSQRLLGTRADGSISVWESSSGKLIDEFEGPDSVPMVAAFLPDGERILTSGGDGTVQILDIGKGTRIWQGGRGTSGPFGIATLDVASTGTLAAWGDALNHRIVVWDLESQQKKFEINNPSVIINLKFSPDGLTLAVAGRESIVRIYDLRNGVELRQIDIERTVDSGASC